MSDDGTPTEILTAAWLAPMAGDGGVIRQGAVALHAGRVRGVGASRDLRAAYPDAGVTDLGNAVLLPGLVNAHVHLDLTHVARPDPAPASFVEWVKGVIRQSIAGIDDPARWIAAALDGVAQCNRFGVTSVGDIAGRHVPAVRAALADVARTLRITSFGEVTAMGARRGLLEQRIAIAVAPAPGLRVGITPHAPYSVEPHGYERCRDVAREQDVPLATHLAETPHEAEFLASHAGPLRDLWDWMGGFDDRIPTYTHSPVRYAHALGLLNFPTLLAHVNYCDDADLDLLAAGPASVVYCPRTHAYFNHPPHRWRDMLRRGVNVALGTDSCASSPDLNLVDDLRLIHGLAPDVPVHDLWTLITTRGAQAIGDRSAGSLATGTYADVVAFPSQTDDPLREVLECDVRPTGVWVGGTRQNIN